HWLTRFPKRTESSANCRERDAKVYIRMCQHSRFAARVGNIADRKSDWKSAESVPFCDGSHRQPLLAPVCCWSKPVTVPCFCGTLLDCHKVWSRRTHA